MAKVNARIEKEIKKYMELPYTYKLIEENFSSKLLLGILNPELFRVFYRLFYSGGGIEGQITILTHEDFPLPLITPQNKSIDKKIVDRILSLKKDNPDVNTSFNESIVDKLVYKLYGLADEEGKVIEDSVNRKNKTKHDVDNNSDEVR